MDSWRSVGLSVLVACASVAALSGQKLRWDLDRYSTAKFQRITKSASRAVNSPPAAAPSRKFEGGVVNATPKKRSPAVNLIPNGSFEKTRGANAVSWANLVYRGTARPAIAKRLGHTGRKSASIHSKNGADASWYCNVKVAANTRYRLSGWIRTKGLGRGAGAQLNVHQLGPQASTKTVGGTEDWQNVVLKFRSGNYTELRINCMLGGFYRTRGQAWFDDIRLVRIPDPNPLNRVDPALFRGTRRPTYLRGEDLDPRRQFLKKPPGDVRDVPAFLAFDLRRDRAVKLGKLALVIPGIGSTWLDVSYMALLTNGTQRIRARLRPAKSKSRKPARPGLIITGEIVIDRVFKDRRLQRFTTEMRLDVEVPPGWRGLPGVRRCAVDIRESWEYRGTDLPEGGVFQARVNQAIRNGARHLRGNASKRPGGGGRLALVVLTLLKAGEDPRDPLMQKLISRLRRSVMRRTYDCAVGIMAIEALYAPANERELMISGRIKEPVVRRPTDEDRETLQIWTDQLRKNIDTRVDSGYIQRWNYTAAARFDNSNTQYAMLGLYTASLCGVHIPATVWFASANHWLSVQSGPRKGPAGAAVGLDLTSYKEAKESAARKRRTVTRASAVQPRGWGYTGKSVRGTSGSMTTAGITGLVICEAALRASKKGTNKLRNRMNFAIRAGFAWLARNFSVTQNPGGNARWHYYYLYGLERACEINGTKLLNGRRWYFEGAELLMQQQSKDGAWKDIEDTCFAILFLKKAAPPVTTGPR
jgi:hypothetical protein